MTGKTHTMHPCSLPRPNAGQSIFENESLGAFRRLRVGDENALDFARRALFANFAAECARRDEEHIWGRLAFASVDLDPRVVPAYHALPKETEDLLQVTRLQLEVPSLGPRRNCGRDVVRVQVLHQALDAWQKHDMRPFLVLQLVALRDVVVDVYVEARKGSEKVLRCGTLS